MPNDYPRYYLVGIQLFERGDYFEAHEAWEWHWKNTPGPERTFFQGMIQIAVALCHFHNGNMHGARKLYFSSRAYLEPHAPKAFGVDVDKLLAEHDRCFAPVVEAAGRYVVAFDPATAPRIALDPPPATWPEIPAWILEEGEPPDDE